MYVNFSSVSSTGRTERSNIKEQVSSEKRLYVDHNSLNGATSSPPTNNKKGGNCGEKCKTDSETCKGNGNRTDTQKKMEEEVERDPVHRNTRDLSNWKVNLHWA